MTTARPPLIELRQVTKALGGRRVLDRLDLQIRNGETFVLLGASGSGKSVTLRHMVGLMLPDEGEVLLDGQDIVNRSDDELVPLRRRISMIFQGGALFDSMTVAANVAFGLVEQGKLTPAEIADRVKKSLELVGLEGVEERMPADLSGGMRKRVSIARSMALDPECLLYDEPTAGLDPVTGFKVVELIKQNAARAHVTSVVVTHDLPAAFFLADRMAFLHEGKLSFLGTPAEARRTADPVLREFLNAYEEAR